MSRRITFFVLAATATLIATQASADRECFEDSCRVTEAETSAMQPSAAVESPEPEASAAAPAPAPIKALPQVIATPLVPAPSPPTVRTEEPNLTSTHATAEEGAPRALARLAPRLVRQEPPPAPAPVHRAEAASGDAHAERVELREPVYRPRRVAPLPVGAIAVAAPGAVYAEDDVVRVYPNPRHDPAWKLCQLDSRERDQRRCGAYSYHPFGANGYRPYGVYGAERAVGLYVVAPNAKIIPVDSEE